MPRHCPCVSIGFKCSSTRMRLFRLNRIGQTETDNDQDITEHYILRTLTINRLGVIYIFCRRPSQKQFGASISFRGATNGIDNTIRLHQFYASLTNQPSEYRLAACVKSECRQIQVLFLEDATNRAVSIILLVNATTGLCKMPYTVPQLSNHLNLHRQSSFGCTCINEASTSWGYQTKQIVCNPGKHFSCASNKLQVGVVLCSFPAATEKYTPCSNFTTKCP